MENLLCCYNLKHLEDMGIKIPENTHHFCLYFKVIPRTRKLVFYDNIGKDIRIMNLTQERFAKLEEKIKQ